MVPSCLSQLPGVAECGAAQSPLMAALIHLTGYRLLEAVHRVVTAGDVRLGTLLAQGGGRAAGHALLDHQL